MSMLDQAETNRNLEVDEFVRVGTHLVVETELVVANLSCRENKVAPTLFLSVHNDPVSRACDLVVYIEGTSRLHLCMDEQSQLSGL